MALEREWLLLTAEKFSREDAQRAELVSHTKIEFIGGTDERFSFRCRLFAISAYFVFFIKSDLRKTTGLLRRFLFENQVYINIITEAIL